MKLDIQNISPLHFPSLVSMPGVNSRPFPPTFLSSRYLTHSLDGFGRHLIYSHIKIFTSLDMTSSSLTSFNTIPYKIPYNFILSPSFLIFLSLEALREVRMTGVSVAGSVIHQHSFRQKSIMPFCSKR